MWSRALDVRLSEWCCSQWCGFKSRRGKNKNLTALKSNSNTVWFNFQTYIYIYIYTVKPVYSDLWCEFLKRSCKTVSLYIEVMIFAHKIMSISINAVIVYIVYSLCKCIWNDVCVYIFLVLVYIKISHF